MASMPPLILFSVADALVPCPASGYVNATRSRYRLRMCSVRFKGLVSHGQNASKIAGAFITACQGNKRGLIVETVKPPREGRGGRPGTFEIDFFPGVILEPADDKGAPTILREVGLG